MSLLENKIQEIRSATKSSRAEAVDQACAVYWGALNSSDYPEKGKLEKANNDAQSSLQEYIFSNNCISNINNCSNIDGKKLTILQQRFYSLVSPLNVPPPQPISELSSANLALVASIGAIAGMMLLTPLTRLLLGDRDIGMFVGPPVGAFLLVLGVLFAPKSKWFRGVLIGAFGVATIVEIRELVIGSGMFSFVWRKLGGRGSAIKRILLYIVIIFLLIVTKYRETYNYEEYRKTVKAFIEQWLDGALLLLILLCEHRGEDKSNAELALYKLVEKIQAMSKAPKETLPLFASEVIQETSFLGFEGFDGSPTFMENSTTSAPKTFVWNDNFKEQYDVFGIVKPGDEVFVEKESIIFNGKVIQKGIVRKARKG